MENEKEEIDNLTQKIIKEIENNPNNCITIFKSVLLGDKKDSITYENYLEQLRKTLKKSSCQGSWTTNQLLISCLDCQKSKNSCICVKCFLKGNHQGHRVIITHSASASCDCGDPLFWSPSGFCSDHPGPEPNPELTQLQKDTRIKLISISKAALSHYSNLALNKPSIFYIITKFLSDFVSIGDATRRCVCIAFSETINVFELFLNCFHLRKTTIDKFFDLLGNLINDSIFRKSFSLSFLNDLPKFIKFMDSYAKKDEVSDFVHSFYTFTFHASTVLMTTELIQKNLFDYESIFKESLNLFLSFSFSNMTGEYMDKFEFYQSSERIITILKSAIFALDKNDSKLIQMINYFASEIVKYEFSHSFNRIFDKKYDDPLQIQSQQFRMYFYLFHCIHFISKENIYTEKPLQLIENFFKGKVFQSIDKNYTAKSSFDTSIYFRSVLDRNVDLALSFATHICAFECLNLKEKSLIDYVKSVTDDVETFLKNWAVIPLRWIAASDLNDFQFFVKNSDQAFISLDSLKFKKNTIYKFVPSFSLIQTLLKSSKNPDEFFLMIISTYGFFNVSNSGNNDLDENQQQLILLLTFYFILCLIFDTNCIEKNYSSIHRLIVISSLMVNDLTIDEIEALWHKQTCFDSEFMDDLHSFASKITTKKESKFHLTNSSEWHPLLPFMQMSSIIPLVQIFIHNNPDSLINFPELPNDSIHLLFSPTLWALEFFILSHKCSKDYQIIQQFVFNTLIITSQYCDQFYHDNKNENDEDDSILIITDFVDLATKLKKLTFSQFMKKKIMFLTLNGSCIKTMIDLISVFGKIGITVLTRMNIFDINTNSPENNQQMKDEMIKKNHERAKMIKMKIMNSFSKQQKSFQSPILNEEEDDVELGNSSKMECSICHLENEEDCFVYPALVYKSPLSSYFKWRFSNATPINIDDENPGILNDFSDLPDSFETFNFVKICLHPIHSKCIQEDNFHCPADRCRRNASIPIIAGIYEDESELKDSVLSAAQNFVKTAYFNDMRFAVYSLASQIEVIEMRQRSNPVCLDDSVIEASLRNIYLCIWNLMRNESSKILFDDEIKRERKIISRSISATDSELTWEKLKTHFTECDSLPEIDGKLSVEKNVNNIMKILHPDFKETKEIYLSPLMKYILSYLNHDLNYTINMSDFINGKNFNTRKDDVFNDTEIIEDLNTDYKLFQFLRCAAIFDHFARSKKITKNQNENDFIDWDLILSSSSLCTLYTIPTNKFTFVKNDEMTLPMFSFIDLPKNFLDFIHPPYSAPILEFSNNQEIIICLLTGKTVVIDYSTNNPVEKYRNLSKFLMNRFNNSCSIFLKLNGYCASQTAVSSIDLDVFMVLPPFYVDKYGDRDIGMERGSLLYLNESKRDEIIDNFLSGLWTDSVSIIH